MFNFEKIKIIKTKGMTLVETLVAVMIFILGIGGFTMLASKSWRMNSFVIESGNATSKATRALTATIKSLRKIKQADDGSYPIKEVGPNSLTVYLDDDNDKITERVHYYYESSTQTFKKGVTKPSSNPVTYQSSDQTVTVVTNYVVNTTSQPVFQYYNNNYPADTTNNPLVNPVPANIRLVKLRLWVNIKPLTAPENINLESFAEFRNLNENN
jgi:type II secretory pathway pseudopilin PulG